MPLYEVTAAGLEDRSVEQFAALGMYERNDLQRLLRERVDCLGDDLKVVAEEFGNWEESRRRIDLLALDRAGRLVVIELKRTDDGGHMELQAIRYAAMVSSMVFADVVAAYQAHCARYRPGDIVDARTELAEFLGATEGETEEEPAIAADVRIVLVSADFSREITTTVLWLNRFEGMDIRCIRLVPYRIGERTVLDIQQILPLPDAADYTTRIRRKDAARERAHTSGRDFTRYHIVVDGIDLPDVNKRNAVRIMIEQLAARGVPLGDIRAQLTDRAIRVLPGAFVGGDEVRAALVAQDPKTDTGRFFCDEALVDDAGATYVVTKMWGLGTESALAAMAQAFPEAGVTFRRAEGGP